MPDLDVMVIIFVGVLFVGGFIIVVEYFTGKESAENNDAEIEDKEYW